MCFVHYCDFTIGQNVLETKALAAGKEKKVVFENLSSATIYSISITALFAVKRNNTMEESPSNPATAIAITAPEAPSNIVILTTFTNTKVSWTTARIAPGASVRDYIIQYSQLLQLSMVDCEKEIICQILQEIGLSKSSTRAIQLT